MERREFLKAASATAALTAAYPIKALADNQVFLNNQPTVIQPRNRGASKKLANLHERHIAIVGGGIAGLSAAMELAERGYLVSIFETLPYLGGRLHTRTEHLDVGSFAVEHGLHMWFYHYFMFEEILKRLGTWERHFKAFEEVYFLFKDYKPEVMVSRGPYPLNLARIVLTSPNLNLLKAAQTFGGVKDVIFYDHKKVYERFDHLTLPQWAKKTRVNQDFYRIIIEPAASVTLNDPNEISAAEMIMYMHYYFIGHPRAFNRKIASTDHGTAVINPWREHLEKLGVNIITETKVPGLRFAQNRIVGTFDHDYDAVILAADIQGTQTVLQNSIAIDDTGHNNLRRMQTKIDQLKRAPSYSVLRVWFDKPTAKNRPAYQSVIETPQHKPINLVVIFNMIEEESIDWARRTGGSVIEFHLYNTPEFSDLSAERIWQIIKHIAYAVLPEITSARPLAFSLGTLDNFTSFAAYQGTLRPFSDTPSTLGVENLTLAGDWVQTAYPSALMERSVATGREAANHILRADGLQEVMIKAAPMNGPGLLPKW